MFLISFIGCAVMTGILASGIKILDLKNNVYGFVIIYSIICNLVLGSKLLIRTPRQTLKYNAGMYILYNVYTHVCLKSCQRCMTISYNSKIIINNELTLSLARLCLMYHSNTTKYLEHKFAAK